MGSRRRGVWRNSWACVCIGGGQALNRDPSWGSITISVGTGRAFCCPDRETEVETPSIFEREGPDVSYWRFIHLSQEGTSAQQLQCLVKQSLSETKRGTVAGSSGCTDPLHSYHIEGHSPHLFSQQLRLRCLPLLPPFPAQGLRKAHF